MIVVYGNLTLDEIRFKGRIIGKRIGGGAHYSSIPLLEENVDHMIVSNISPIIKAYLPETHMGITRAALYTTSENYFILDYDETGNRKLWVLSKAPQIPVNNLHVEPGQYAIVNPVLGEIDTNHLKKLWSYSALIIADVQGFIREVVNRRIKIVPRKKTIQGVLQYIDILHVGSEEYDAIIKANGDPFDRIDRDQFIVVTRGYNPPILIHAGKKISVDTGYNSCKPVKDSTGAGDYFTAMLFKEYIRSRKILRSILYAYRKTCIWLNNRNASSRYTAPTTAVNTSYPPGGPSFPGVP